MQRLLKNTLQNLLFICLTGLDLISTDVSVEAVILHEVAQCTHIQIVFYWPTSKHAKKYLTASSQAEQKGVTFQRE